MAETSAQTSLIAPDVGNGILKSTRHYHDSARWHLTLMLIMPDHVHALMSFSSDSQMSRTVSDWKRFTARALGVVWQSNFFDHRIRNDQEGAETFAYILRNPIAKGLIGDGEAWPWIWRPV